MLIGVSHAILQAMADMELPTIKTMEGKKVLELLCGISGAFRPGVLTALMGVSGAGKTTLMDVLAGRKTGAPPPDPAMPREILFEGNPQRLLACRRHHRGRHPHQRPCQGAGDVCAGLRLLRADRCPCERRLLAPVHILTC